MRRLSAASSSLRRLRCGPGAGVAGGAGFSTGGPGDAYSAGYTRRPPNPAGVGKSGSQFKKEAPKDAPEYLGEGPPGLPPIGGLFSESLSHRESFQQLFPQHQMPTIKRSARREVPGLASEENPAQRMMPFSRPQSPLFEREAVNSPSSGTPNALRTEDSPVEPTAAMPSEPVPPRPSSYATKRASNITAEEQQFQTRGEFFRNYMAQRAGPSVNPNRGFSAPGAAEQGASNRIRESDGPGVAQEIEAAKNTATALKPPPVRPQQGLPRSMLDLDAALDDEALATKMTARAASQSRDSELDAALGVDQDARPRAIPRAPVSRDKHGNRESAGSYVNDDDSVPRHMNMIDPSQMSPTMRSLTQYSGTTPISHNYDWFARSGVMDIMSKTIRPYVPPDIYEPAGYRLSKPPQKGVRGELKRLFSDYDWGDRKAALHVLNMYPYGDWILTLLIGAVAYKLYHFQLDHKMLLKYDEYLGLDLRFIAGAERGMIAAVTLFIVYVLARHSLVIASITINRLWRMARKRPLGPP